MLDVANAWFEVSDLFSVLASSDGSAYVNLTGVHWHTFHANS